MRISSVLFAVSLPCLASAGDYDGVYRPAGYQGWDCKTIGSDGGALAIKAGQFFGVESACDLTNPTPVRGMDATLFDMICSAEGESYSERLMIMHSAEGGIVTIRNGYASALERCPD